MLTRIRSLLGFETRATLADPDERLFAIFGATPTAAGVAVTPHTAMHSPTTLAACRTIAETIGAMPIQVFQRSTDGTRERNDTHPVSALLAGDWCPWSSSTETRTQLQFDALQFGNGYAAAARVNGQVRELHRLDPLAVTPQHDNVSMEPSYRVRLASGGEIVLPWRDVVNIKVPGSTPTRPIHLVELAREAIALDIAMASHQGRIFENGARPSGMLKMARSLSPEAAKRLKESAERSHAGRRSGGTMVLEEGMDFTQTQFSSVDLQFLELRRFAIQEIGRVFKIPATFIGDLERATWRNVEELSRQFLTFTLLPWLDVWQAAISRVVFTPEERTNLFVEFQTADLLRGDVAARFAAYRNASGGAWLTPNEVRKFENLPSIDGGDELIKQAGQSGAVMPSGDPQGQTLQ